MPDAAVSPWDAITEPSSANSPFTRRSFCADVRPWACTAWTRRSPAASSRPPHGARRRRGRGRRRQVSAFRAAQHHRVLCGDREVLARRLGQSLGGLGRGWSTSRRGFRPAPSCRRVRMGDLALRDLVELIAQARALPGAEQSFSKAIWTCRPRRSGRAVTIVRLPADAARARPRLLVHLHLVRLAEQEVDPAAVRGRAALPGHAEHGGPLPRESAL